MQAAATCTQDSSLFGVLVLVLVLVVVVLVFVLVVVRVGAIYRRAS